MFLGVLLLARRYIPQAMGVVECVVGVVKMAENSIRTTEADYYVLNVKSTNERY